ncbi:MAG: PAS domain-containing protein [Candidatus Thorarchaeota archaeon]
MKIEPLLNSLKGMSLDFLSTVLDTLPVEFTIIDADDNVLFWNRHGIRVFKRGPAVINRNVRMCHPAVSIDKVELVIERLKSGEEDYIDFWIDLPDGDTPRKLLIRYYALRDDEGNHLGILETTINLTPLQAYTGELRLDDLK